MSNENLRFQCTLYSGILTKSVQNLVYDLLQLRNAVISAFLDFAADVIACHITQSFIGGSSSGICILLCTFSSTGFSQYDL